LEPEKAFLFSRVLVRFFLNDSPVTIDIRHEERISRWKNAGMSRTSKDKIIYTDFESEQLQI
jgi:hypothetical protein